MCYPLPYPRCSSHTRTAVQQAQANFDKVALTHEETSLEFTTAKAELTAAKSAYRATPEGIKNMEAELANPDLNDDERKNLSKYLSRAKLKRQSQMNALHEFQSGRLASMTTLLTEENRFDADENKSIIEAHTSQIASSKLNAKNVNLEPVSQEDYNEFVDTLAAKPNLTDKQKEAIEELRNQKPCDAITLQSYQTMDEGVQKAETAVTLEQTRIGGLHNIDAVTARQYYEAYRKQYKDEYAHLPESERPDPPRSWLKSDLKNLSPMGVKEYKYIPNDAATNYAAYRLRTDDSSVPSEKKRPIIYSSIDLETAGPAGNSGFNPANGHIIEVGIVKYDEQGKELSRYSKLMKPNDSFLAEHGTGAEHIHHISVKDLDGQPAWNDVASETSDELSGTVMIAQNAYFEQSWLNHHLPSFKHQTGVGPVIDTLDISRRVFDLPNYKLETVCTKVGVPYTNGHRATHDAEVAGEAFFKIKKTLQKQWDSKPARKNAKSISI